MPETLTTQLRCKLEHTFSRPLDLSVPTDSLAQPYNDSLADGDAANEANMVFLDTRGLIASHEDIDLYGAYPDAFGSLIEFDNVKTMVVKNHNEDTGETITVGGSAGNQFDTWVGDPSDKVIVGPDGVMVLHSPVDGYGVTDLVGDQLRFDAGANHVTYEFLAWGAESQASVSASMSQSKSQSISRSRLASPSQSRSQSLSQSRSESLFHSISEIHSQSQSKSRSQSQSQSKSKSWSQKSISHSRSISVYPSRSMSASQSRSRSDSMFRSRSQEKSQSQERSQSVQWSQSMSRSESKRAFSLSGSRSDSMFRSRSQSKSRSLEDSLSKEWSRSQSKSRSQELSQSQEWSRSMSKSQSKEIGSQSTSRSKSQSKAESRSAWQSQSQSKSRSQSASKAESKSAWQSQSVSKKSMAASQSQSRSQSQSLSQSLSRSRSASMKESLSAQHSQSQSKSQSMSQSKQAAECLTQDNFNRVEDPLTDGGAWSIEHKVGADDIQANGTVATLTTQNDVCYAWRAWLGGCSDDMYVELDASPGGTDSLVTVQARASAASRDNSYELRQYATGSSDPTFRLYSWVAGVPSLLDSANFAGTATIKLECIGTAIKGYRGGVERVSGGPNSDHSTTSYVGIGFRKSTATSPTGDNFEAGET